MKDSKTSDRLYFYHNCNCTIKTPYSESFSGFEKFFLSIRAITQKAVTAQIQNTFEISGIVVTLKLTPMAFQMVLTVYLNNTVHKTQKMGDKQRKRLEGVTLIDRGERDMTLYKKVFFALLILAMGFSGGIFAQIWLAPSPAEASYDSVFRGSHISLYGTDSNTRMQMGTYVARGEKGLPFIGLSDNKAHLRLLFRLGPGRNESPVLVFKDSHYRDRMVIGLAMNNGSEEPYIAFFDESGEKHLLMGEYPK